jgi:hypothetical protein
MRRFGGDLQGVLNKLDYLQDLGVREIDIIEKSSKEFEGRPYDELINHNFTI